MTVGELIDLLSPYARSLPVWMEDSQEGEVEPAVVAYRERKRKAGPGEADLLPCTKPDDVPVEVLIVES